MTPTTSPSVPPELVHSTIRKHLIGDGLPLVVDLRRSHGSWLVDAQTETEYLDLFSFFASLPLGFNHPAFHEPRNARKLFEAALHKPSNSDAHTRELAEFVDAFAAGAGVDAFPHLFFIEGGALAVENALKTAFDWKVRKNLQAGRGELGSQVVHFRAAFHGRSGYTLSLTNTLPNKTDYFPKLSWPRINNPRLKFPVDAREVARVSAEESSAVAAIRQAFAAHPHDIAAIIIEPIQGEGGDNHFRADFFAALRSLADEHEALLIFDEVQTGFGVTGRFWAHEHFGVKPDILCFGKKSQVCGIAAGPRVDEVAENVFRVSSRINSTWGGGLADMVRCQIILDVIHAEGLVANAARAGAHLLQAIEALQERFPGRISNTRGRGLLCAFDCTGREERDRLIARAREERLLILPCGDASIRLRPALNLGLDEADEAVRRLQAAVSR